MRHAARVLELFWFSSMRELSRSRADSQARDDRHPFGGMAHAVQQPRQWCSDPHHDRALAARSHGVVWRVSCS